MTLFSEYQWLISAFAWMLLHSIWQIFVIGVVWLMTYLSIKKGNVSLRHSISILAMGLIIITSCATLFRELKIRTYVNNRGSEPYLTEITSPPSSASTNINPNKKPKLQVAKTAEFSNIETQSWFSLKVLKYLVAFWLAGIFILGFRFLLNWLAMRRLAQKGVKPFDSKQLSIFHQLKNKIGIRKDILFLQSNRIGSPLTFGFFKPIILFPLGLIAQISPKQLEVIMLHELIHIQRGDFLVNLLQIWVEILFFYHPFTWIISKKTRILREQLCDDTVIAFNQDKIIYAEALIYLQKYFFNYKNQLTMNAQHHKSELNNRIHRLFQAQPSPKFSKTNSPTYLLGIMLLVAMSGYAFSQFSSSKTVSIAVDKMNILYTQLDNPITVAVAGVEVDQVSIKGVDMKIKELGNGHYTVMPTKEGRQFLDVFINGQLIKKAAFQVECFPDPVATLGGITGGSLHKNFILKLDGLELKPHLGDLGGCHITYYDMVWMYKVTDERNDAVAAKFKKAKFNDHTKNIFQRMNPGDVLYFDNVKCKCQGDTEERAINSLVIKIK